MNRNFKTQVCQYVRDLLVDERNVNAMNNAAKSLMFRVTRKSMHLDGVSVWDDDSFVIIPNPHREGKFRFWDECFLVSRSALTQILKPAFSGLYGQFSAAILNEWLLLDWHYDFNSCALKDEFWEFNFFVFEPIFRYIKEYIYDPDEGRDNRRSLPNHADYVKYYANVDSSNWLNMLIVRHAVRYLQETVETELRTMTLPFSAYLLEDHFPRFQLNRELHHRFGETGREFWFRVGKRAIQEMSWFVRWYTDADAYFYTQVGTKEED